MVAGSGTSGGIWIGESGRTAPVRVPPVVWLGVAFAAGIILGRLIETAAVWPSLTIFWAALAGCGASTLRNRSALRWLLIAAVALGMTWMILHDRRAAANDLMLLAMAGASAAPDAPPIIVRLRGDAVSSPRLRDRLSGSMSRFDYRPPSTFFRMHVRAVETQDGELIATRGEVWVRVGGVVEPFRAGDALRVVGRLSAPMPVQNPGEFDFVRYTRSLGQVGTLEVASGSAIDVLDRPHNALISALRRWQEGLRYRASAWLLADLPERNQAERSALLAALLLGERGPNLDELGDAFRRIGLAHLLAISGLHLGILAGLILLVLRTAGISEPKQAWVLIAAILVYLVLVDVRMPVLRAGVMTMAACLALASARRMTAGSLVAVSGVVLLLWRPDQLFSAGFQLSFGVVLGLLYLAPHVRTRWFGLPDLQAPSTAAMIGQWLASAFAVAVTAWLIASPIVAYHFGHIAPLAAPLSVMALPIVAVLLACGYLKMLISALLPSVALLLGVPLSMSADVLTSLVWTMDDVPLSTLDVATPGLFPAVLFSAWTVWWAVSRMPARRRRRTIWPCGAVLLTWLIVPGIWPSSAGPLRVDMLSVGEGSCYLIRSGRSAVLFDAGSYSDFNVGNRSIVPALKALRVRSLDAVVISHAHLDHYSAVIEVADALPVERIMVAPHLLGAVRAEPHSAVAHLVNRITDMRIPIEPMAAGAVRRFGESTWTFLHPHDDDDFALVNDASLVVRVEAAGRRLLMTGDVEESAFMALRDRGIDLRADVIELPHHGAANELAREILSVTQPAVVMQSCGRRRLARGAWEGLLESAVHLVTARDGACTVTVDVDGTMRYRRFRDEVAHKVAASQLDATPTPSPR